MAGLGSALLMGLAGGVKGYGEHAVRVGLQKREMKMKLLDQQFTASENQKNREYQRETAMMAASGKAPTIKELYDKDGQPYKAQWNPQTKEWDKLGGSKAVNRHGMEIELPDGTVVRQGPLGKQDEKNIANRVNSQQDAAASATSLKQLTGMLREANQNTGYSGVGGETYGKIADLLEQTTGSKLLGGDARSRATIRAGGLQIALENVSKTKGAISNAEMELFMAASPGLQNTQEGNAALLDMIDAIADRTVERTNEMEKWRSERGNLEGFEKYWNDYLNANPLIVKDGSSVRLNRRDEEAESNDGVVSYEDYF